MKKIVRNSMSLLLVLFAAVSLSSCNDDDNGGGGGTTATLETKTEALLHILAPTANVDSVPADWNTTSYTATPTIGTVYDESTDPTVRYIVVNSKEEAAQIYASIVPKEDVDESITNDEWNMDGIGTMSFTTETGDASVYGIINMDIKQMPQLTQLKLVSENAVGENWGNNITNPYYRVGDVVKRKSDNTLWICVRACGGDKGKSHWLNFVSSDELKLNSAAYKRVGNNYVFTSMCKSSNEAPKHMFYAIQALAGIANPDLGNTLGWELCYGSAKSDYKSILTDVKAKWDALDLWSKIVGDENLQSNLTSGGNINLVYDVSASSSKVTLTFANCKVSAKKQYTTVSHKTITTKKSVDMAQQGKDFVETKYPGKTYYVRLLTGAELEETAGLILDQNDKNPTTYFDTAKLNAKYVYNDPPTYSDYVEPVFIIGDAVSTKTKNAYTGENDVWFCVEHNKLALLNAKYAEFVHPVLLDKNNYSKGISQREATTLVTIIMLKKLLDADCCQVSDAVAAYIQKAYANLEKCASSLVPGKSKVPVYRFTKNPYNENEYCAYLSFNYNGKAGMMRMSYNVKDKSAYYYAYEEDDQTEIYCMFESKYFNDYKGVFDSSTFGSGSTWDESCFSAKKNIYKAVAAEIYKEPEFYIDVDNVMKDEEDGIRADVDIQKLVDRLEKAAAAAK